jgi:hypothetical protein
MPKRRRDGTYPEPLALRRLRKGLSDEQRIEMFRVQFGREPLSDDELNMFIEVYTSERYNSGCDESC